MDSTADHQHHHQAGQVNLLPTGVAHNDNSMGMMMMIGDNKQIEPALHMNNQHDGHHGEHMNHGDGMSMMKMYFHFGLGDVVLFKDLIMDSNTTLLLTCLVLFLCGVLLELIDYSRGYLSCRCRAVAESLNQYKSSSTSESHLVTDQHQQTRNGSQDQNWNCCSGSRALNQETESEQLGLSQARKNRDKPNPYKAQFFPVRSPDSHGYRALQAALQFIRTGLSLALMLVAMTYNICLIFPILLGSAVGFYIFYRPALDSKSVVCH